LVTVTNNPFTTIDYDLDREDTLVRHK
ncbi:MAG: hypothetical protein RIR52_1511, partial [Acidobacteriota bacterium]